MALELYANNCSTTIAVTPYTAGSGVLNVASTAAPWPQAAAGSTQFHILVYRIVSGVITAIVNLTVTNTNSTTQWAVTAEGADASALVGDSVIGVLSFGGMDQIRADLGQTGTFANRPATTNQKQGNRYKSTDSLNYYFDGSLWQPDVFVRKTAGNPAVDITNSNVETTLWSQTIQGNSLGATGQLRVTLLTLLQNTVGTQVMTFRIKFGATTAITHTVSNGSNANPIPCQLIIELANLNATNAQYIASRYIQGIGTSLTLATSVLSGIYQIGTNGTTAVDTTADQNLVITAQWTNQLSTTDLKMYAGRMEQF